MAKELFLNSIAGFSIIWLGMYNIYMCVCVYMSVANIIKFYLVLLIIVAELKRGFCFMGESIVFSNTHTHSRIYA